MKKTNNKGFSLVELIIVIAIMAILIGVLAPQYIKYVEKSRVSADKDVLDSVYNALTTAASDPEIDTDTIPDSDTNLGAISKTDDFGAAVADTLGCGTDSDWSSIPSKLKSKGCKGKTAADIKINVDGNGNFTVYVGDLNAADAKDGITVGAGAKSGS